MDSRILIFFSVVFVLFCFFFFFVELRCSKWNHQKTFLSHMVSASPPSFHIELFSFDHNVTRGIVNITRLMPHDSPLPALQNPALFRSRAVDSSVRHFQTALMEITLSGQRLTDYWHWPHSDKVSLGKNISASQDLFSAATTSCNQAGPSPSGGTLRLWSWAPRQSANINFSLRYLKKKKKCQMPLALSAGTCYHSHCLETLRTCRFSSGFVLAVTLFRVGCSSRPLTSSPLELGWNSSQSLSLLPGVGAIQWNSLVRVFWASGGFFFFFFWSREVFGSSSPSVLYLLVF